MTYPRLILVVLEVESLDASVRFYRDLLGVPLVPDIDHGGSDRWISGAHAATSWHDGAFLHFALYQSKGVVTRDVQIGFPVDDLEEAHKRLVAEGSASITPRGWSRGEKLRDTWIPMAMPSR